MKSAPRTIACSYCGGSHSRAAEVRTCWERSEQPSEPSHQEHGPLHAEVEELAGEWGTFNSGGGALAGDWGPVLGRSVVVAPGQAPPAPWASCERASGEIDQLERAWHERTPLVIEAGEELGAELGVDEAEQRPVWSLSPLFSFPEERRAHAMFANAVDARCDIPRWHLAEDAMRLGATWGGPADVLLPGGQPAYCDGGPLHWQDRIGGAVVVPRLSMLARSLFPFGSNGTDAPLAPDQLAAVTHPGGTARIIAPAGSGKTRVLTERARHLLGKWNLPARSVTLVAFNKRAADEIKERTTDLPSLQVRTLNALGLSLVGRSEPAKTIEEREVRSILNTLVDLPRRANTDPAAAWIEALSTVRLGLRSPSEVETEFEGDVDGLAGVFERYRRILAERGLVDFDEQIYRAIEILLTDPAARRSARMGCRVLLVDEFQDLTPAHLLLIRLLAGPDGAVFGVGDDDQTIYGYSGASPEWLIDYKSFFPHPAEHSLEVNYRCPVAVVEAARTLLTHNRRRVDKSIAAAPGREANATELEVRSGDDAYAATVEVVSDLVTAGAAPKHVAVLARVNASLAPVQVALVHREIPVRPSVDLSYLSRGGVHAALAWLRLAISSSGQMAGADIASAARRPSRALSPKVIEWMSEQKDTAGLERLAGRLGSRDADKVYDFADDLQAVRRAAKSGTAAVLRVVRDQIGLDQAMEMLEESRRWLDRSAQTDDLDALVALAALHPDPGGFEGWLRESLSHPGSVDGVMLSTIHRVKGREWPHVVVHDVSAGLMPHRLAVDIEEERRILHVGLTRGSSSVHLVAGDTPSPFLAELTEEWAPKPAPARKKPRRTEPPGPHREPGRSKPPKAATQPHREPGRPKSSKTARLPAAPIEVVELARQALRGWRSERASSEGKPAYIFLHDATLEAIATSASSTMAELAKVKGVGPAKLEAYGDELLALIAAAREGAGR